MKEKGQTQGKGFGYLIAVPMAALVLGMAMSVSV
jgi:hypothetical protein